MEEKIKKIIDRLNKASKDYYNGRESMPNAEWDALYDELRDLEEKTGVVFPDSPSISVGALPKTGARVVHEYPAKSLDKTKNADQIFTKFASEKEIIIMWKLDGGTMQLTYNHGRLLTASTRGNGEIGQDITANAKYILGIPSKIDYQGKLVIRGEAIMSYSDFNRINEALGEQEQYANPRNLANATISMLDSEEVSKRKINFSAFAIVHMDYDKPEYFCDRLHWLSKRGFCTVDYEVISPESIIDTITAWTEKIETFDYPVDGLVFSSNDIAKCEKLPGTEHHPNVLAGYAFKWADTEAETTLREIEWSASRTGLLNPIAVFDAVELEGTSVSRASLHNFSYVKEKHLRIGDNITVYKANMIIPQVRENVSNNLASFSAKEIEIIIPYCPVCNSKAVIHNVNGVETMHCENPECSAKSIGKFVHFAGRNSMDIEGLSEATITKFVELGFLSNLADIYKLSRFREKIINMEGFGEKSWNNLNFAIEGTRERDIVSFITAIGIPNIGKGQAKLIVDHFNGNASEVINHIFDKNSEYDFTVIEGIGEVINNSIHDFARKESLPGSFTSGLLKELNISDINVAKEEFLALSGKTFVITGSVNDFVNRNELKEFIESRGGKVTGTVTSKTSYLINNDVTSVSGKNKKAIELGVPVISEREFLRLSEG